MTYYPCLTAYEVATLLCPSRLGDLEPIIPPSIKSWLNPMDVEISE